MKDDRVFLLHIRDAIDRIESYAPPDRDGFARDLKTQDAIIRNLEVIGEAVKALSPATWRKAPEIRWRQIAGMRDRLIHQYFGVDLALVWDVVTRELPTLGSVVRRLLGPDA